MSKQFVKPNNESPGIEEVSIKKVLEIASQNKISHPVCQTLLKTYGSDMEGQDYNLVFNYLSGLDSRKTELSVTLTEIIEKITQYVVPKTYRKFTTIPNDIDILVPEIKEPLRILQNARFSIRDREKHQILLVKEGIKVHLHDCLSWANSYFFNNADFFQDTVSKELWGVRTQIPDPTNEFLIHMAHINYEPLHITLADFFYLYLITPEVDWEKAYRVAQQYGWSHTLSYSVSLLNRIYEYIYGKSKVLRETHLTFPYTLPRKHIINAFIEKKAFLYVMTKVTKGLEIIITNDSYNHFYYSPEEQILQTVSNKVIQ